MPICYRFTLRHLLAAAAIALCAGSTFIDESAAQSLNVVLQAHLDSLPGSGSSCWGYIDPNTGVEYAILGNQNGTAIWNIATPSQPQLTGFIPGVSSSWRELKVYKNYVYVGTEGGGGMQIIDVANPEAPFLASTYTGSGLSSIHTVTVDTLNAKLYANGANGGCRILDLTNPLAPVQVGNYTAAYVHDSHVRNDTLYAACYNAGQVRILNVSNPAAITQIVAFSSEMTSTHNCWTTEDRQYLLVTDETSGGRVTSWDISTITSPIQVDGFTADVFGDAHNVQIRDNFAYVAHYTSGLQILDVTDPTNLTRVGFYDTYAPAGGLYNGAWGVFNDFPSGAILISDIEGGLFIFDFIEAPSYVRGTVRDATTLQPIPGARVLAQEAGASDSTDGLGNYLILANAGSYTLEGTAYGYGAETTNATTTLGDTLTVDIALTALPSGSISGVFRYPAGAGIPNAIIRLESTPYVDTTDASGLFSFPQVLVGTYEIQSDFWTSIPDSQSVSVASSFANTDVYLPFEAVSVAFDFEDTSAAGWAVNAQGGDNATFGIWTRVNPRGTGGGLVQPEDDHSRNPGAKCWVTGQGPVGGGIGDNDVDGGRTTLTSGNMDLSLITDPIIQYYRWYVNDAGSAPGEDVWKVQISSNGGTTWVTTDSTRVTTAAWKEIKLRVSDYFTPTTQVRMRFIAEDAGSGSIVEAGVDDFRVWGRSVTPVAGGTGGSRFALLPNSPNPFNPQTEIRFDLAQEGRAQLSIYTADGRRVRTLVKGALPAGRHAVAWDGRDERGNSVASGVYLMRLESGKETAARKIVLAK